MALATPALLLLLACTPDSPVDDGDGDGVSRQHDCDDADPAVGWPSAEVCNGVDDDCDGTTDEGALDAIVSYLDSDGDGYGDSSTVSLRCPAADTAPIGGDCDDTNAETHPEAVEVCNDTDDDCDGTVDLGATDARLWFEDHDRDGWGGDVWFMSCTEPRSSALVDGDCDDFDFDTHPEGEEVCDGRDNDCDGEVDEQDCP